ncbi:MAG: alpha/beta family hydrolase [Rhizobiaceae bacterium]
MAAFLYSGPADARYTLLLAHGAGAPMDSDWMNTVAEALGARGIRVARFEFGYMAARRDGQRPPPSPANKLIGEYLAAIGSVKATGKLFIGGKSMGGRMASMIADKLYRESKVAGLVCLGYPFHPPGNPEKLRTDHLEPLTVPTLICQGERDPFGTREEVETYPLSKSTEVFWLPDGDHDLKPRKASGLSLEQNIAAASDKICEWVGLPA